VAIVAATLLVAGLEASGVATGIDTIGTRFGADAIPSSLPMPHLALPSLDTMQALLPPAFTIALLAAIESLLSAVVADGMLGGGEKHDSNTELMAQGLANIASASVGGLPVTGALARTAANIRCGGRTPVAGVVAALTVGGIMAVAAPAAAYIPLPALSAVLVLVAINMGEWRNFAALPGWPRGDAAVFLFTFALTVLTDVTIAVEAGLALSAGLYLQRVGGASGVSVGGSSASSLELLPPARAPLLLPAAAEDGGVHTLRLRGALLFGCTDELEAAVGRACDPPAGACAARVLLLDCSRLLVVDVTGLEALQEAAHSLDAAGKSLVLAGLQQQPHAALSSAGFLGARMPPCMHACAQHGSSVLLRSDARARAAALHCVPVAQSTWATPTWCATRTAQRARARCWRRCMPQAHEAYAGQAARERPTSDDTDDCRFARQSVFCGAATTQSASYAPPPPHQPPPARRAAPPAPSSLPPPAHLSLSSSR
jgi:SulP family sulfate permease